ncbi:hypothetical protein [Mycobacterium sp. MMS18-G62]
MDPDYERLFDQERRVDDAAEKWTGPILLGIVVAVVLVALAVVVWVS